MPADESKILSNTQTLSAQTVRRVAGLARLALTDAQVEQYRDELSKVLGYADRLRGLDLAGVEPLSNVGETTNRFRDDELGPTLDNSVLMAMAPAAMPPFVRVPKVLGDGGGA